MKTQGSIRIYAAIAAVLVVGTFSVSALAPFVRARAATSSVAYLQSKSLSSWTAMALSYAGQTPDMSFEKNVTASAAIDLEVPIMALAAAGDDPRTYGSADLVAALKGYASGGQIGDASLLNDDIFGVLALLAAGVPTSDSVVSDSVSFIKAHQNSDGGWGYAVGGSSDSNTTAAAVMALVADGVSSSDASITQAVSYLHALQQSNGGFFYDGSSTSSDASSDAWVAMAIDALGGGMSAWTKGGNTPITDLQTMVTSDGAVENTPGAGENSFTPVTTAYVVIALGGGTLPVSILSSSAQTPATVSVNYRIEGSSQTLCEGTGQATNAMDVLSDAKDLCGISDTITNTSYGPYVAAIGSDSGSGSSGWMYAVNGVPGQVAASDATLSAGDTVLWYFGDYNIALAKMALSTDTAASGGSVTATVEGQDSSGTWQPLAGATVHVGSSTVSTATDGTATLTLGDGVYHIYADKDGYVRTDTHTLTVGSPEEQSVALSATVGGSGSGSSGGTNGTGSNNSTIAFSVDPSAVDFGSVTPGTPVHKSVTITNTGSTDISVSASVSGGVFEPYLTLDQLLWRFWNTLVGAGADKSVNVDLHVPQNATETGAQTGELIFWATPQN